MLIPQHIRQRVNKIEDRIDEGEIELLKNNHHIIYQERCNQQMRDDVQTGCGLKGAESI